MTLRSVKSLLIVSFMLGSTAAGFAFKSLQQAAELASMAPFQRQVFARTSALIGPSPNIAQTGRSEPDFVH